MGARDNEERTHRGTRAEDGGFNSRRQLRPQLGSKVAVGAYGTEGAKVRQ